MKGALAITGAALLGYANAACNNACSGHGSCGTNDACTCHKNWQGGDCSERVCAYGNAWATQPQGDLNMDGDMMDGTYYSDSHFVASSSADMKLLTQAAAGGTWETWPSQHSANYDEGHFYMECSNKGMCDRQSGECKCFAGYTGASCQRTTCANDCSGHGVCKTMSQLTSGSGFVYKLWDADMATACDCDAGYAGASCAQRTCPKGDDVLTKDHQIYETQWIEIKSDCDSATCTGNLGGTATITVTDDDGDLYTTDSFSVVHMDGSSAPATMASAVKTALEALSNNVIRNGITVTPQYCEKPLPGTFSTTMGPSDATIGGYPFQIRCPDLLVGSDAAGNAIIRLSADQTGDVVMNGASGAGAYTTASTTGGSMPAGAGAVPCNSIPREQCIRLQVEFVNPGDVVQATANTALVTRNGRTDDQDTAVNIAGTTVDQLTLTDDAAAEYGYTNEWSVTTSAAAAPNGGQITINSGSADSITLGSATTSGVLPQGSIIQLLCGSRVLGDFTVAAHVASGASDITVTEDIIQDNNGCIASTAVLTVKLLSNFLTTNTDYTNAGIVGKTPLAGNFDNSETADAVVTAVAWDATNGGFIYMGTTSGLSTDVTQAASTLTINGKGTMENVECGDRGVCDRDIGTCKCFRGYSDDACGSQNVLAV